MGDESEKIRHGKQDGKSLLLYHHKVFAGIKKEKERADLITYLTQATS